MTITSYTFSAAGSLMGLSIDRAWPQHIVNADNQIGAGAWYSHSSPSVLPGGNLFVVLDCPGELGAAGDAQLAEDLAQVVLHGAGADEQPGGDLRVGQVPGHHPGDLRLLRREHLRAAGPRGRACSPVACSSRLARSANAAMPMASNMPWAMRR